MGAWILLILVSCVDWINSLINCLYTHYTVLTLNKDIKWMNAVFSTALCPFQRSHLPHEAAVVLSRFLNVSFLCIFPLAVPCVNQVPPYPTALYPESSLSSPWWYDVCWSCFVHSTSDIALFYLMNAQWPNCVVIMESLWTKDIRMHTKL